MITSCVTQCAVVCRCSTNCFFELVKLKCLLSRTKITETCLTARFVKLKGISRRRLNSNISIRNSHSIRILCRLTTKNLIFRSCITNIISTYRLYSNITTTSANCKHCSFKSIRKGNFSITNCNSYCIAYCIKCRKSTVKRNLTCFINDKITT